MAWYDRIAFACRVIFFGRDSATPTRDTADMNPSFAASYGSHMVLQQAPARAVVWGFAPVAALHITLTLASSVGTVASIDARLARHNATARVWLAKLPPIAATRGVDGRATAYSLTVQDNARASGPTSTISDVVFGEVWVCSGQSNMAFLLEMDVDGKALLQQANDFPEVRFVTVAKHTALTPQTELLGVAAPYRGRRSNRVAARAAHFAPAKFRACQHMSCDDGPAGGPSPTTVASPTTDTRGAPTMRRSAWATTTGCG